MTTKTEEQVGGVPPLKHWQNFTDTVADNPAPLHPGAAAVKRIGRDKAAKAIYCTVLEQDHVGICERLSIDAADYAALVLLFAREIRRARISRKRREYAVKLKESKKSANPQVLEKRIRKLGALIPKLGGGTYEDESPEVIVDAAMRLGRRMLCRLEAI